MSFDSANKAGRCEGFLQGDPSQTKAGLVVLHEWWGLNDQIQEAAAEIVLEGNFMTLIPDLYRGEIASDMISAADMMTSLDWHGAMDDAVAAVKYLLSNGCSKVGITGFSMGGALSLATATVSREISAASSFYGIPILGLADLSKIKVPVQCHFGELDEIAGFSSLKDVEILRRIFKVGEVPNDIFLYPAGHAFTNPNSDTYVESLSQLAFHRLVTFMKNHLVS